MDKVDEDTHSGQWNGRTRGYWKSWVLFLVSLTRPKRLLVYAYNQWELLGGSKGVAKLHFLAKLLF